ncbi:class I SAM-dependent methyltransferase [Streptomyces mexicanus]|uniref:class I SAM-dependent methyltransferase n=1 Tax=Streptomyces mexicanus TaxID=178566 RepID=UPI0036A949A2
MADGTGTASAPWPRTTARRDTLPLLPRPVGPERRTGRSARRGAAGPWVADPYADALRCGRGPLYLRRLPPASHRDTSGGEGDLLTLDIERWCAAADAVDLDVLNRCAGPVLDVGCGPGRLVGALAARGVRCLGVDVSPAAVALTRRRGGSALRRSVFDRLPGEGRWGTVLLMDGNVGIGGDPVALLRRLRAVAASGSRLLAEASPEDVDERLVVRVEDAHGRHGRPFRWARVGTAALLRAAEEAGWTPVRRWSAGGRRFVELRQRATAPHDGHPAATERSAHP